MLYSYIYIALYYIIVYSYHIILYYITIVWSWLAASSRVLALASFCLVLLLSHLVSANLSRSSSPILYKWYIASQFARLSSSSEINKVTSYQRYNHNIDKYLWHEHEKNIKSHCTRSVQCTMCNVPGQCRGRPGPTRHQWAHLWKVNHSFANKCFALLAIVLI